MIYIVASAAIVVSMAMAVVRALLGPTVYDRVLAVNNVGTNTVLIIAVVAFFTGRPDFIDLALVYAMISFVGTIAVLKFFKFGNLSRPFATRRTEP